MRMKLEKGIGKVESRVIAALRSFSVVFLHLPLFKLCEMFEIVMHFISLSLHRVLRSSGTTRGRIIIELRQVFGFFENVQGPSVPLV